MDYVRAYGAYGTTDGISARTIVVKEVNPPKMYLAIFS